MPGTRVLFFSFDYSSGPLRIIAMMKIVLCPGKSPWGAGVCHQASLVDRGGAGGLRWFVPISDGAERLPVAVLGFECVWHRAPYIRT